MLFIQNTNTLQVVSTHGNHPKILVFKIIKKTESETIRLYSDACRELHMLARSVCSIQVSLSPSHEYKQGTVTARNVQHVRTAPLPY
jgi:hypothetical protein